MKKLREKHFTMIRNYRHRVKMQKLSLIAILLVLIASLFLLAVLSNVLTGYPEPPLPPETEKNRTEQDRKEEPSVLVFKVSPIVPRLYCRVSTADYYTGLEWLKTTNEEVLEELPMVQDANATEVFTIEINVTQRETLLPLLAPNSTFAGLSLASNENLRFYVDRLGDVYKVIKHGQVKEVPLIYNLSWRDVEVDDRLISFDTVSEELRNKYLQLPNIPIEVWELAEDLVDPSYSIFDQVLADVQYLRTDFVYDVEAEERAHVGLYMPQRSDVFSYIQRRRGVCMDAATALAVILRIQKIPARVSLGFKAGRIEGGKLLYYTTGGHAVTEVLLPPYGWVQFDATPPTEENPLVKVSPFKKESAPGSQFFYQLSITNGRDLTDNFRLFVRGERKWDVRAAPEELKIDALQTAEALLEVNLPDNATIGEKDVLTVTVASRSYPEIAFSIKAVTQVENIVHVSTTTSLKNTEEAVLRGNPFWVNGTIHTANDEQADSMTIFVFLTKSTEAEGLIIGKGYSEQRSFQIEGRIPWFIEVGDYKVIPICLGTAQYAPSSSECAIRVCAATTMKFGSEKEFLLGYGAIRGHLLWDNGTGFAAAPISLMISLSDTPSKSWELQNLTFGDGSFRIKTTFEDPGTYAVRAVFSGNEYALESNATRLLELKRGVPEIHIIGETTAIRGYVFNITGAVRYQEVGVFGESIAVTFDDQLLATVDTRENGSYTWSFLVDSEEMLGPHFFTMALKDSNVSAVHKVVVKSRTKLTAKVSNVSRGMSLLCSLALVDDHDLPIDEAEIGIDNYGLSWDTDKNGDLTFLLDIVKLWPENLVLTARFEGSELYLPVATKKEVVLEPFISLPFLIPLVAPALVAMGFVYATYYTERSQRSRPTGATEVVEETPVVVEEYVCEPQTTQPLRIVFPDIGAHFPNVWGVGDNLRVGIVLSNGILEKVQKREVEVLVDEETVASVRLSQQGCAELSQVFAEKGKHKVGAILPRTSARQSLNAETRLRVVDYREEIIRLYNEFLERLSGHGINARKEMTAREIQSLLLRIGDFIAEVLDEVTTFFEKAKYSNHLLTRNHYEIMYLSLKELDLDVEPKD